MSARERGHSRAAARRPPARRSSASAEQPAADRAAASGQAADSHCSSSSSRRRQRRRRNRTLESIAAKSRWDATERRTRSSNFGRPLMMMIEWLMRGGRHSSERAAPVDWSAPARQPPTSQLVHDRRVVLAHVNFGPPLSSVGRPAAQRRCWARDKRAAATKAALPVARNRSGRHELGRRAAT